MDWEGAFVVELEVLGWGPGGWVGVRGGGGEVFCWMELVGFCPWWCDSWFELVGEGSRDAASDMLHCVYVSRASH